MRLSERFIIKFYPERPKTEKERDKIINKEKKRRRQRRTERYAGGDGDREKGMKGSTKQLLDKPERFYWKSGLRNYNPIS